MRVIVTAIILAATLTGPLAADLKLGWMVQFQQEQFSGKIVTGGYVAEVSEEFQKAGLAYVCAKDGRGTFAFYPRGFGFEQEVDVDFRRDATTATLHFAVTDVPTLGPSRVLQHEDAQTLKEMLAGDGELAYRQGESSGTFPTIGAAWAIEIVDGKCES